MILHPLLLQLAGGDRRSIGAADKVAQAVLAEPELFAVVLAALELPDPVLRMRAADVVEKVTRQRPDWLQPYKEQVLAIAAASAQAEVLWHVAQMLPRLTFTAAERERVYALLTGFLDDRSQIVRVTALQALADLAVAGGDEARRRQVVSLVRAQVAAGGPAVRARGRRLLKQLGETPPRS